MRIGPPNRDGFTNVSNIENERMFNDLTPEQFRLYVGLRIEANFGEPRVVRDPFGRPFTLEPGEVLVSYDGIATRYAMSRSKAQRALETFERIGLGVRRSAVQAGTGTATPDGASPATRRGKEAATPPSVFRFTTDRERCWNIAEAATPASAATATGAATPRGLAAATIQPQTHSTNNPGKETDSTPRSRAARSSSSAGGRSREAEDRPVGRADSAREEGVVTGQRDRDLERGDRPAGPHSMAFRKRVIELVGPGHEQKMPMALLTDRKRADEFEAVVEAVGVERAATLAAERIRAMGKNRVVENVWFFADMLRDIVRMEWEPVFFDLRQAMTECSGRADAATSKASRLSFTAFCDLLATNQRHFIAQGWPGVRFRVTTNAGVAVLEAVRA